MAENKKGLQFTLELARKLSHSGRKREAIKQILNLCRRYPKSIRPKELFAELATGVAPDIATNPRFIKELCHCIEGDVGDTRSLVDTAGLILKADSKLSGVLALVGSGTMESNRRAYNSGRLSPLIENRLILTLLGNSILPNYRFDLAFTALRRLFLFSIAEEEYQPSFSTPSIMRFFSKLALQCWFNEYIYNMEKDEKERIVQISADIQSELSGRQKFNLDLEMIILVYTMYKPLHHLEMSDTAWNEFAKNAPSSLHRLVEETNNYYSEQQIMKSIPQIGEIGDDVSISVRQQYENNPYPRWIGVPRGTNVSVGSYLKQLYPNYGFPDFLNRSVRTLIAGCGTGQEAISFHATFSTSKLLAIDLSRRSLAYAIRRSRELRVSNIDFQQADILQLESLPKEYREFDVITASGVLHHMRDPIVGWRTLVGLLRSGGIMFISLYSELARRLIVQARERISELELPPDPESIRSFRNDILNSRYPQLLELRANPDFYSLSACRDLLFHVQEWRFTIDDIDRSLHDLGLSFVGFTGIEDAKRTYHSMFPSDPDMRNLDNWSAFESKYPDTFVSMYHLCVQKHA